MTDEQIAADNAIVLAAGYAAEQKARGRLSAAKGAKGGTRTTVKWRPEPDLSETRTVRVTVLHDGPRPDGDDMYDFCVAFPRAGVPRYTVKARNIDEAAAAVESALHDALETVVS